MGTGTATLFWYVLCAGFVAFIAVVAWSLIRVGERRRKKRIELAAQREGARTDMNDPPSS